MSDTTPIPAVETPGFAIIVMCGEVPFNIKLRRDGAGIVTPDLPNSTIYFPLNVGLLAAFKKTLEIVKDAKGGGVG